MPQSKISVNAVIGSDDDVPINVLVQLDNVNIGGEVSFSWTILDQPPGTADVLSASAVQNPTFTPKKEGTYLIKLVVNSGLPTEQQDRVIVGVRQLKTLERIPAAGETTEGDASDGWATSQNSVLRRIDTLLSDPGIIIGVNDSGGTLVRGDVVRASAATIIKSALPGQETVPGFSKALATTLGQIDELLCVVEGTVAGAASVPGVGTPEARLMKVRYIGRLAQVVIANGPVAIGDTIYVNDTGILDKNQGTIRRRVGSAMSAGATADVWFNGVGGADIDLTPIDRAYVVLGNPGTLPNAIRVDGSNATGITTPYRIKAGDAATVPFQVQGFAAGADLSQWLDSGGSVLTKMTITGDLEFTVNTQLLKWPNVQIARTGLGILKIQNIGNQEFEFDASLGYFYIRSAANTRVFAVFVDPAGEPLLGSVTNHSLTFFTNNVAKWQVTAAGALVAQGANRAIQSVLDPVSAQDAATRNYNEQFTARSIPPRNFVLNSDMRFWQRGTTATALTTGRIFRADRWYAFADAGAGLNSTNHQTVLSGVNYNTITRTVGETHVGAKYLVQEIEYEDVAHLVAMNNNGVAASELPITLQVSVVPGLANSVPVVVEVRSGTSGTYDTGYAGDTLLASLSVSGLAIGVLEIPPGTIPTTATRIAVIAKFTQTGVAVAGQSFSITNVNLCLGRPSGPAGTSPTNIIAAPNYAGGSFQGELARLQRYYEKSYELDTAPATLTAVGESRASVDANTAIEQMVQFRITKRVVPTLTFYNPGAANANWVHAGGATGINPLNISTRNFDPDITGVPNAVAASTFIRGHWAADAEV